MVGTCGVTHPIHAHALSRSTVDVTHNEDELMLSGNPTHTEGTIDACICYMTAKRADQSNVSNAKVASLLLDLSHCF